MRIFHPSCGVCSKRRGAQDHLNREVDSILWLNEIQLSLSENHDNALTIHMHQCIKVGVIIKQKGQIYRLAAKSSCFSIEMCVFSANPGCKYICVVCQRTILIFPEALYSTQFVSYVRDLQASNQEERSTEEWTKNHWIGTRYFCCCWLLLQFASLRVHHHHGLAMLQPHSIHPFHSIGCLYLIK